MSMLSISRRLRLNALLTVVTVGAALFAATSASAASGLSGADGPTIQATTFADEFNGPAGSRVDGSKWVTETGDNVNNHERQFYTTNASNASMDGQGNLVITARRENPSNFQCWYGTCQYTSARLNTSGRFTQTYGHFETRMQIPRGQGMWPAFWMLGNNIGSVGWPTSGEIDIMENIGREPNTVHGTIHGPGYSGAGGIGAPFSIGSAFADGFHIFAIDWSPNRIAWSVDGTTYEVRTPNDLRGNRWVFDHPFFILLNLAVGGDFPGDPNSSTTFPQRLVVDYVRVTDGAGGGGGGGGGTRITGLGGKCVDVAGASTANGTAVQLFDCNGTTAQQWTVGTDGTIRALGKCLDVTSAGTADGTRVQLWDCNGTGAQRWSVTAARDIINANANKCLDATGSSSANGTRLQIWTCNGAANQKWTVG
jgi:beta-glucanase (GH16 family)